MFFEFCQINIFEDPEKNNKQKRKNETEETSGKCKKKMKQTINSTYPTFEYKGFYQDFSIENCKVIFESYCKNTEDDFIYESDGNLGKLRRDLNITKIFDVIFFF
jgi:hypothetical protein